MAAKLLQGAIRNVVVGTTSLLLGTSNSDCDAAPSEIKSIRQDIDIAITDPKNQLDSKIATEDNEKTGTVIIELAKSDDALFKKDVCEEFCRNPICRHEVESVTNTLVESNAFGLKQFSHNASIQKLKDEVFRLINDENFFANAAARLELDTGKIACGDFKSAWERISKNFECSICLNLFASPTITNCGHTFCASCIHENARTVNPDCSHFCPECRQQVTNLTFERKMDEEITRQIQELKPITKEDSEVVLEWKERCWLESSILAKEKTIRDSEINENEDSWLAFFKVAAAIATIVVLIILKIRRS